MKYTLTASLILFSVLCLSSCIDTRKATYFNNVKDTTYITSNAYSDWMIQKHDILNITISSLNQQASEVFNLPNGPSANNNSISEKRQVAGYMVDNDGNIQLPMIGNVSAAGNRRKQLQETITKLLTEKQLLLDPIVQIRHMNFEVTVIGEVGNPTVISVPNENISLLKALGFAGDITPYGKKNNVLLIREENGKKEIAHINLNEPTFITSKYYYLKPNDVVYVESNKNRLASVGRGRQIMPAILSGISVAVIVLDRIL